MNAQVSKWLADVNALVAKISSEKVLLTATTGTQAEVGKRVWDQGKTTDGQPIGYLQDYEVYGYKPPAPRKVSGRGKPYDQWKRPPLTKAGTPRKGAAKIKGGYYSTYLDFKADQGRRETPLDLSGEFRKGYFSAAALVEGSDALTVDIVLQGKNVDKWHGLTNQKGEFLELNQDEKLSHVERLRDIWQRILDGEDQ
jgi:hypothetical protein